MRANNPTEAGLWELSVIWPSQPEPSLVLSIGTGFAQAPAHELLRSRGFWLDGFMPRILRAFLSSPCLHGQNSWLALLNRLDAETKKKFLRMNVEFEEQEPALDDTSQFPRLRALALQTKLDYSDYRNKIWATSFFFELTSSPRYVRGLYRCDSVVGSRFNDARPLLTAITKRYGSAAIVLDGSIVQALDIDLCCRDCGCLRMSIQFDVHRLDDQLAIKLRCDDLLDYAVSGSPYSVLKLDKLQTLWNMTARHTYGHNKLCCRPNLKRAATLDGGGPGKRQKR